MRSIGSSPVCERSCGRALAGVAARERGSRASRGPVGRAEAPPNASAGRPPAGVLGGLSRLAFRVLGPWPLDVPGNWMTRLHHPHVVKPTQGGGYFGVSCLESHSLEGHGLAHHESWNVLLLVSGSLSFVVLAHRPHTTVAAVAAAAAGVYCSLVSWFQAHKLFMGTLRSHLAV